MESGGTIQYSAHSIILSSRSVMILTTLKVLFWNHACDPFQVSTIQQDLIYITVVCSIIAMGKCGLCNKEDGSQERTWPDGEFLCRNPHASGAITDYAIRCDLCQMWCNAGWVKKCAGLCLRMLCERHRNLGTDHCEECLKTIHGNDAYFSPRHS